LYQYACSVSSSMYDTHSFPEPGADWSSMPPLVIARCVLPPSSLPFVSSDSGFVQDASP
jgi:hypothetical protein